MNPLLLSPPDLSETNSLQPDFPVSGSFQSKMESSILLENSNDNCSSDPVFTAASKKHKSVKKKTRNSKKFRSHQCEKWQERFLELLAFREKHGHCLVPHRYEANSGLAGWVKRQRYQYNLYLEGKKSTITQERIRILNNFGFIWDSHEAVWQERLRELQIYKEQHGNCAVPCNYEPNPKLGVWAKCQRRQYRLYLQGKPCNIDEKRILDLERIGFNGEGTRLKAPKINNAPDNLSSTDYDIMMDVLSILSDDDDETIDIRKNNCLQVPTLNINTEDCVEELIGYISDLSDYGES